MNINADTHSVYDLLGAHPSRLPRTFQPDIKYHTENSGFY